MCALYDCLQKYLKADSLLPLTIALLVILTVSCLSVPGLDPIQRIRYHQHVKPATSQTSANRRTPSTTLSFHDYSSLQSPHLGPGAGSGRSHVGICGKALARQYRSHNEAARRRFHESTLSSSAGRPFPDSMLDRMQHSKRTNSRMRSTSSTKSFTGMARMRKMSRGA